ncbi:unnamed protein product [Musa banksii]
MHKQLSRLHRLHHVDVVLVEIVVVTVTVVVVVADDVRGVITCFSTTVGIGPFFLHSSSFTSSSVNRSSSSPLVRSEIFPRPLKSSDSTCRCDRTRSAASTELFELVVFGVQFFDMNAVSCRGYP